MTPELAVAVTGGIFGFMILRDPVTRSLRAAIAASLSTLLDLQGVKLGWPLGGIGACATLLAPLVVGWFAGRHLSSLPSTDWEYHNMIRSVRKAIFQGTGDLPARLADSRRRLTETPPPSPEWNRVRAQQIHQLDMVQEHINDEGWVTLPEALAVRRESMAAWREAIDARRRSFGSRRRNLDALWRGRRGQTQR